MKKSLLIFVSRNKIEVWSIGEKNQIEYSLNNWLIDWLIDWLMMTMMTMMTIEKLDDRK